MNEIKLQSVSLLDDKISTLERRFKVLEELVGQLIDIVDDGLRDTETPEPNDDKILSYGGTK